MPVPSLFTALATTPASNSPAGSETPQQIDEHLRQIYAFLKSIFENTGNGWATPYALPSQLPSSGFYTPTMSIVGNVSTVIAGSAFWQRVGNIVSISGVFTATTSGLTSGSINILTPVASDFTSATDCAGVVGQALAPSSYTAGRMTADAAANAIRANFFGQVGVSSDYSYTAHFIVR